MSSIFTKIINNEIPSYKLYEDDKVIAILDIFPKQIGHTLIIPKTEIDYWVDLPDELVLHINTVAIRITKALTKAVNPIRIGTMVIGTDVPHYHLHLIPIFEGSFWNKTLQTQPTKEEFIDLQSRIKGFLE
jgi:histidine triad (HIT) family protein